MIWQQIFFENLHDKHCNEVCAQLNFANFNCAKPILSACINAKCLYKQNHYKVFRNDKGAKNNA